MQWEEKKRAVTGLTHSLGACLQFGRPLQQLKWSVRLLMACRIYQQLAIGTRASRNGKKKLFIFVL